MTTRIQERPGREARLKVLYLVPPSPSKGGISRYSFISEEIEALIRSGVEAHIVSSHVGHDHVGGGYRKHALPRSSGYQLIRTIWFLLSNARVTIPLAIRRFRSCLHSARVEMLAADIVRREGIDLIHSHFGWPSGIGGLFARNSGEKPLVTSVRGMDILINDSIAYGNRRDSFFDAAFRMLLDRADAITCFSDYIRTEVLAMGAPPGKTVTVLKGVDLARFASGTSPSKARLKLNLEQKFTVLSVGGLIPRKGMDHILRAVAQVRGDLQCVICGSGPELDALRALAKQLEIDDKVLFKGQISREEISTYFDAADVFVLASINEAAGNVLLEAAASGRPIITTSSGGPPEYVGHEEYGYIVAPGDVSELAGRIQTLFDDPQLCAAFGRRARVVASQRFSYDLMIRTIMSIYERTLRQSPRQVAVSTE